MSDTRNLIPPQPAIAAWTVGRVGGPVCTGRSGMTHPTVPFPIYRGLMR